MKKYTLMQKDEPVASFTINEKFGYILSIDNVFEPERLPVLARYREKGSPLEDAFQEWMNNRNMPKTREGIGRFLAECQSQSIANLSLRSLGLNLSDQYWFKPEGTDILWKDVNFFQHDFSDRPLEMGVFKVSPDFSSNGELPKYWTVRNHKRYLVKAGKRPFFQQVENEVIASDILDKAGIRHVPYARITQNNTAFSICPTFITPDTEYVPAYEILHAVERNKRDSNYQHFVRCVTALHLDQYMKDINQMLQFDYLINNSDRHYYNFGFIRNVNTLQFEGTAPVFDNGNSLWHDTVTSQINVYKQPVYPFSSTQDKQIKLTGNDFSWLDRISEYDLASIIQKNLSLNPNMKKERIEAITRCVLINYRQMGIIRNRKEKRRCLTPAESKSLHQALRHASKKNQNSGNGGGR